MSMYMDIYQYYRDKIEQKELVVGDTMPTEGKIMQEFAASRDTVRKAMGLLVEEGYIDKGRGRESRVASQLRHNLPASETKSFVTMLEEDRSKYDTAVEDLSIVIGDPNVMSHMNVDEAEEVFRVIRTRALNGERIILDKDFLLRRYVPNLTRTICGGSLYAYAEKDLGLQIGLVKKVIQVRPVTREDQLYMDLHDDPVVAVILSFTQLEDGTIYQCTESRYRIDKFQFVEYAKR